MQLRHYTDPLCVVHACCGVCRYASSQVLPVLSQRSVHSVSLQACDWSSVYIDHVFPYLQLCLVSLRTCSMYSSGNYKFCWHLEKCPSLYMYVHSFEDGQL